MRIFALSNKAKCTHSVLGEDDRSAIYRLWVHKTQQIKEVQSRGVLLSVFGISIISRTSSDLSLWVTNMSDRGRQEQPGENLRPDAMLFRVKPQPFQEFHSSLFRRLQQRCNPPFIVHPYKDSLCLLCGFFVPSLKWTQPVDNQQKTELYSCGNAKRSFSTISLMTLRRSFDSRSTMS